MNQIGIIMFIVVIWAFSGFVVSVGIRTLFGIEWIPQCITLNIVIGLILLQVATRHERGSRQIYEGKREEDQFSFSASSLIGAPILLIVIGLLWWLFGQFVTLP